jgi:hypothetical protein
MRGIWSKTVIFTVAVLGFTGCGGSMEEGAPEDKESVQEQVGDVVALGGEKPPPCDDADCKNVTVSPKILWPPNHKFRLVTLSGARNITITSVRQDEPVNGQGDGNTSPDAMIVDGQLYLRAERSGQGNGRVYCIDFKVTDSHGKKCTGTVFVGVPHDQGQHSTPINDGCNYNSLAP